MRANEPTMGNGFATGGSERLDEDVVLPEADDDATGACVYDAYEREDAPE